jgi:hypothetical protein
MDVTRNRETAPAQADWLRRLPDWPIEFKLAATAALTFAGLAVLMGATYVVFSHQGTQQNYTIDPNEVAALYTGPGVGLTTLISLAHIHLLGLFPVFTVVGIIFLHSTLSVRTRAFWAVLPYAAFIVDVVCWFLTKWIAFGFVYGVIGGGFVFIVALGVMILVSLYQFWLIPRKPAAST